MREQEPGVDEIVPSVILELLDVKGAKLDVAQLFPFRVLAGELQLDFVLVDPFDTSRSAYDASQGQAYVTGPAADVQAMHA